MPRSENSMRGSERVKSVALTQDTLQIESIPDENEFNCYQDSCFSTNFQLPIRRICPKACVPLPLAPGTWIITEIIQSTDLPGDLSRHFMENGEQKKLHWQLQVS